MFSNRGFKAFQWGSRLYRFAKVFWKPSALLGTPGVAVYGYTKWDAYGNRLQITNKTEAELTQIFQKIDLDQSGEIDAEELDVALKAAGLTLTNLEIKSMVAAADLNGNGKVSLSEFIDLSK